MTKFQSDHVYASSDKLHWTLNFNQFVRRHIINVVVTSVVVIMILMSLGLIDVEKLKETSVCVPLYVTNLLDLVLYAMGIALMWVMSMVTHLMNLLRTIIVEAPLHPITSLWLSLKALSYTWVIRFVLNSVTALHNGILLSPRQGKRMVFSIASWVYLTIVNFVTLDFVTTLPLWFLGWLMSSRSSVQWIPTKPDFTTRLGRLIAEVEAANPMKEKITTVGFEPAVMPGCMFRIIKRSTGMHIGFGCLVEAIEGVGGETAAVTAIHVLKDALLESYDGKGGYSLTLERTGRSITMPVAASDIISMVSTADQVRFRLTSSVRSILGLKAAKVASFSPSNGYIKVFSPDDGGGVRMSSSMASVNKGARGAICYSASTVSGSSGSPLMQVDRVVGIHTEALRGVRLNMGSLLWKRTWLRDAIVALEAPSIPGDESSPKSLFSRGAFGGGSVSTRGILESAHDHSRYTYPEWLWEDEQREQREQEEIQNELREGSSVPIFLYDEDYGQVGGTYNTTSHKVLLSKPSGKGRGKYDPLSLSGPEWADDEDDQPTSGFQESGNEKVSDFASPELLQAVAEQVAEALQESQAANRIQMAAMMKQVADLTMSLQTLLTNTDHGPLGVRDLNLPSRAREFGPDFGLLGKPISQAKDLKPIAHPLSPVSKLLHKGVDSTALRGGVLTPNIQAPTEDSSHRSKSPEAQRPMSGGKPSTQGVKIGLSPNAQQRRKQFPSGRV